jgi:ATP-dependent Zn protease
MKWNAKTLALCLIAIGFAAALRWMAVNAETRPPGVTYSQFLQEVKQGTVDTVSIAPGNSGANPATYRTKDGNAARTVLPSDYRDAIAAMQDRSVNIEIKDTSTGPLRLLTNAIPFLILAGLWLFMMGKLRSGTRIA